MKRKHFVIGIDGGGTKTTAIVADNDGNILAEQSTGPTNPQVLGFKKSAQILLSLILNCCKTVNGSPDDLRAVTIGLAGAGRATDQKKIKSELHLLSASKKIVLRKIIIESDARVALEGAFNGGRGIVLIAGTGSIVLAKDTKERIYRAGGWGRILGDEGGGFSMGIAGLNAVTRHLDGRLRTKLTPMIATQFGLKTREDIIQAVYTKNFYIAGIAPLVINAAKQKDKECLLIVRNASRELTELVASVVAKAGKKLRERGAQKIPLAFAGGLISGKNFFSIMLQRDIVEKISAVKVVQPATSPAYGAVLMSLSSL